MPVRFVFVVIPLLFLPAASAEETASATPPQPTRSESPKTSESGQAIPVEEMQPAGSGNSQHAQDEIPKLDPITVTATKTPRSSYDVPASLSVVDQTQIEERGAATFGQALRDLPGVAVEGGPRPDAEFINIRGLSGPRVLLIVDGARQDFYSGHRSSLMIEPEMLKQVEVLRGPASALWGSDAIGGVVAVTTRDASDFVAPGERIAARLRAGYDSAAQAKIGSALGATRFGDFDAVADVSWRDADDYRLGDGGTEPHTAFSTLGSLAKFSWLPEGPHRVSLGYQGFRSQSLSPSNPATAVNDENPLLDRTNDQRYLVARYGFDSTEELGWLQAAELNIYRNDLDIREDRVDQPRQDQTTFHTTGGNGHASLPIGDTLLFTVGGEIYRDGAHATRDDVPRPQFPDSQRSVGGGFVQAELPLGPFMFVPGVRYDHYSAESNTDTAAPVEESAVSPKLGVVWRLYDGLRLRASYAHGFRAPSLIELYSSGQHFLGNNFVPNPDLRPEKARNVEVGLAWATAGFGSDQRFTLNGSVYRNRIRDFIELMVAANAELIAPQCAPLEPAVGCVNRNDDGSVNPAAPPIFVGGTTTSRNLTNATLTGGEIEAAYTIGPVKLSADYSRVRGDNDDNGQPLATIPADTVHASFSWDLPWSLRSRVGFIHAFEQNRVPTASTDQITVSPSTPLDPQLLSRLSAAGTALPSPTPAYSLWNASVVWAPDSTLWGLREPRVTLGMDNLLDARYREHLNTLSSPGRSFRVSLSTAF